MKTCYRQILQQAFLSRRSRNTSYSLRSFARDLEMSPANLSQIFSEKNGLSPKKSKSVAQKLNLSDLEAQIFCTDVLRRHSRLKKVRQNAEDEFKIITSKPHMLDLDAFSSIEEWYHLAILEYLNTNQDHSKPAKIASHFGISVKSIQEAIDRLKRLGLVSQSGGKLVSTHKKLTTGNSIPSKSIRMFHAQVLQLANHAIENQEISKRELSSTMISIKLKDLDRAKEEIREFRKSFCSKFSVDIDADEVYCLSMQFFSPKDPSLKGKSS